MGGAQERHLENVLVERKERNKREEACFIKNNVHRSRILFHLKNENRFFQNSSIVCNETSLLGFEPIVTVYLSKSSVASV